MTRWPYALVFLALGGTGGAFLGGSVLQGQAPVRREPAAAIPQEPTSYRDVVKRVLPAVVSIDSKAKARPQARRNRQEFNSPEEFRRYLEERRQDEDSPQGGFGSGFLVDPKGVILTNNHVVQGASQVEVQLHDGRKFVTGDIKTDPKTDLAIVRINAQIPLPYLEMGDSEAMEIGDRVLAAGAPFGLTGSVTHGIVSATGRNGFRMNMYEDFIQTDAAINPGNSGGPLVNLEGKVIGINSMIKSRNGGFQGIGLAIASNLAKNVMQQLLRDGVVRRGYLGVQITDLDQEVANRLGVKGHGGVVITEVFDDAPGARGGIREGDVIVSVGNRHVKDGRDLQLAVSTLPLGRPADVTVYRDGQLKTLRVTIEEQPADYGKRSVPARRLPRLDQDSVVLEKVGAAVTELTAEVAQQLGYKEGTTGVLVTSVEEDSIAAGAGLRRGMVITRAERKSVTSPQTLQEVLTRNALARGVLIQVQVPQGGTNYLVLKTE